MNSCERKTHLRSSRRSTARPHCLSSFLPIGIEKVSVNIRSHTNRRVTQYLTHDLNLHALSEHETRRRVTQFMRMPISKTGDSTNLLELPVQIPWVDGCSD
jgi:hypothetical protein